MRRQGGGNFPSAALFYKRFSGSLMKVRVYPCHRLEGRLTSQPSKNYTTRYLLAAALAEGESIVQRPARSDDATALMSCLLALGADIRETGDDCIIRGFGCHPKNPGMLNPGNAGTVLRLLLGTASLLPEVRFITDYPDSLGRRPNQDLLDALSYLGVKSESENGRLPITLRGGGLHGGEVFVAGEKSSQYLSSILFLAPLIGEAVEVHVTGGLKSGAAVMTTLDVMRESGISVEASSDMLHFKIRGGQEYQAGTFVVNGDWPGSAAILAAAAVCLESNVTIKGLSEDRQGERAIVQVLSDMGADIVFENGCVHVSGGQLLRGVEFDGDKATDAVLAMVGAASFARGRSRFYNVENLRIKECDRISDTVKELSRLGVSCSEKRDEIIINGNPNGYEGGCDVDGHDDHRVIMLLTILGLRTLKGITIYGAEHIGKSYPDFFKHLTMLGAHFDFLE